MALLPHSLNECRERGLSDEEYDVYLSGYMVQQKELLGAMNEKDIQKHAPDPEILGAVMVKLYGEDDGSTEL